MPLEVTFTLSDMDLAHFQAIVDKAKSSVCEKEHAQTIEDAARKLLADARATDLPEFIEQRLAKLELIIEMIGDEEWNLNEEDRQRVVGALVYFCDPGGLIPDHVPGLGFLDDAIYVELIIRELKSEIDSYEDFCQFRKTEEARRTEAGEDPRVGREEWLAEKRASLQSQMHKRGGSGDHTESIWRLRW